MDQESISNVCILFEDESKAIDYATWLNFKHRSKEATIFFVINGPSGDPTVVSDDVWESFMEEGYHHTLPEDYSDISYEHIQSIAQDDDPPYCWEEIQGMISVTDHAVLRFILEMKVPLERFIRFELASSGIDKNGKWIGFKAAKELWQTNEE